MADKFYYIDKEGNKKRYYGKIISQPKGKYNGVLTLSSQSVVDKELIYHPEVEEVNGSSSYYSYINSLGEEVIYYGNIQKDEDKVPYFTYVERNLFDLKYYPEILPQDEYFTYIDSDGQEKVYTNKDIEFNSKTNSYIGKKKREE